MRWSDREESSNVEDRRGMSGGTKVGIGGTGLVIVLIYSLVTRQNPLQVLNQVQGTGGSRVSADYKATPHEEELRKFTAVVLKDTENVWHEQFKTIGREYVEPKLVVFTGQVESQCGLADAGMGPFYCGNDQDVYIDLGFYDQLKQKFGAGGDFAQAYVIAHEVGHHVQKLLGTLDKVHALQANSSARKANELSVRLELQADFYAGLWAHQAKEMESLNEDDIRSALNAANAIGDDTLQKHAQGYVRPDLFTHGTSAQRVRWFMKGWESGDMRQGDTFGATNL